MTGRIFTLPGGRALEYELSDGSGSIVLLANPLGANYHIWDTVVGTLHGLGFRTLRYNQPGHGKSGVPADLNSTTFVTISDDVKQLIDHLGLQEVFAWIGVSMGAATGIVFVSRNPGLVNKLVPCDTITASPPTDVFGPRVAAAREAGDLVATGEGTRERWFGHDWMAANPDEAGRVRELMLTTTVDGFETCCAALRDPTFDLRPLLRDAGLAVQETLCVVGEKDADLPVTMEEIRAGLQVREDQQVKLEVIPNAGHVCFVDGFEEFKRVVLPFLGSA